MILSDAVLRAIANHAPANLAALHAVPGMGPAKVDRYGTGVLAVCRGETAPAAAVPKPVPAQTRLSTAEHGASERVQAVATREASRPKPAVSARPTALDGAQVELEARLKEWRKEEAGRSGLPSFFVLSDTSLRSIVQARPRSVEALRGVGGLAAEKVEKFGGAIVELCLQ